jgi:hypothetical protein
MTAARMDEISAALNTIGDKPAAYTPTVASGWTSNFTISGTNQEVGNWTTFTVTVTFSGAPAGSGVVNITLPSTPSADYVNWSGIGTCTVRDSSAVATVGTHDGVAVYAGGTNVSAYLAGTRLQTGSPMTFASGDIVFIQGRYYRD